MFQMRRAIFILLVSGLLLAPGCLQKLAGGGTYSTDYVKGLNRTAIYDESQITECKLGECICMSCKNATFSWFRPLRSMVGGNCYFLRNCTSDKLLPLMNMTYKPSESPRRFMIGQGYSFNDFGDANGWCGNRLDMAVQWLIGSNTTPYSLPDTDRAKCMLDKGVMPVYVLYSNSKAVDAPRAGNISYVLGHGGPPQNPAGAFLPPVNVVLPAGPVGPVIITTEMDFNSSNDEVVRNVTEQIRQIDLNCGNQRTGDPSTDKIYCMVALGVRMGDTEGVRKVMEQLGPDSRKVDLIAFGINAHTMNLNSSSGNGLGCNSGDALRQAVRFAQFALYNYSKPTVIPYVMYDANGTDSVNSCNWTEAAMDDALLTTMSPLALLPFQKAGVIGIAAYDFNSSQWSLTNPLNCLDCAIGKNDLRMRAWFGTCTLNKVKTSGSLPAGDNTILFSNASGGTCDYNINPLGLMQMVFGDSGNPQIPAGAPHNDTAFRCDACVSENLVFPFSVPSTSLQLSNALNNYTYCKSIPQLDLFAGRRNLDPMLMRAIAIGESGMNPCSAACVVPTGVTKGGCMTECYGKALDFVPEPDTDINCQVVAPGQTPTFAQEYKFWEPPTKNSGQADYRWCGLGLMGVIEPPYTMWPQPYYVNPQNGQVGQDGPFYDGTRLGGYQLFKEALSAVPPNTADYKTAKAECGDQFNPFNATYAACWGTAKFAGMLKAAYGVLDSNNGEVATILNVKDSQDREKVMAYYIALLKYRGFWDAPITTTPIIKASGKPGVSRTTYGAQWIYNFDYQKKFTAVYCGDTNHKEEPECKLKQQSQYSACFDQSDFIYYVRECEFRSPIGLAPATDTSKGPFFGDYGSRILSTYLALTSGCDTAYCPSWKRLASELCQNAPLGGVPSVNTGDRCLPKTT